jgi:DNA-binding CsgD family transcriptional regulator
VTSRSIAEAGAGYRARSVLQGRRNECDALDRLLERIRVGESSSLVLRGEAGIGKTALLEYVAAQASWCRVARAVGVQSEMELAFAGLHHLCAPLLDGMDALPAPQREALEVAFGMRDGASPDRFLVALAALSLLAETAEAGPLLCVIDDAQWLDSASALVLAFVARRLLAERIAIVFAVREPVDGDALGGLPELRVEGLADADARALLASALPGRLDERVRDRIVAESRGNPLALRELPRGLTPAALAGGFGLPGAPPLAHRIEQTYLQRAQSLPPDTQLLLLVAAAEPVGDLGLLWRAAERLGIGSAAAGPAEAEGLIELGFRVRFKHPLVRSAVYRGAAAADRRRAHAALADATDATADPDRRAWHAAYATAAPDAAVAGDLERSAKRAQRRGGLAAAAAFLQRAAELTPDPAERVERTLAAARAKLEVADFEAASDLVTAAQHGPVDELQRARAERLRAEIAFSRRRGTDAPPLLLEAAQRLQPLDAAAARETYLEAITAAMYAGRLGSATGIREAARMARSAPPGSAPRDLLLSALVTRFAEDHATAFPALRDALHAFAESDDTRWLWLACRLAQDVWDDELWHALATRAVRVAREEGAIGALSLAANYRAALHVHSGAFDAAAVLIDEVEAITQATGISPLMYAALLLAAWRGDDAEAFPLLDAALQNGVPRGEGHGVGFGGWMSALLHNAGGRYDEALAAAQEACEYEDVIWFGWSLAELVEAAVRAGRPDAAAAALARLSERTRASGTGWALGVEAVSRALVHDDEAAYRESIEHLSGTRAALHLARSRLLYGEWLRRENRRADAREHLRAAHDAFACIGAEAFAERARRELAATGETARRRDGSARDALTPQEAQVARMARDGHTNPEIGAQLFISPRTVEYHLHKVFRKLDVTTRKELRGVLGDRAAT